MADRNRVVPLVPCRFCGRSFAPDILKRHEPICVKATLPKRKPFDSYQQRIEGTDLKSFNSVPSMKERSPQKVQSRPRNNWRQQHEQFMNVLANARETKRAMQTGGPLPPPLPAAANPDYIQCKFCGRRFSEAAAQRHIPFCQSKAARSPVTFGNRSENARYTTWGDKSENKAVGPGNGQNVQKLAARFTPAGRLMPGQGATGRGGGLTARW
jgi:Fe-S-cluster-containing dehydrogenase component